MSTGTNRYGRFQEVWTLLTRAAAERHTLTYGQLAERLGGRDAGQIARGMGRWLDPIAYYCDRRGLPRLSDLVVSQSTGVPGYKATSGGDFAAELETIFAYDWNTLIVNPGELADAATALRASKRR